MPNELIANDRTVKAPDQQVSRGDLYKAFSRMPDAANIIGKRIAD